MTKSFMNRVLAEGSVDTRNYRYIVTVCQTADEQYRIIKRLPLSDLDTTAAIDGWETVAIIK